MSGNYDKILDKIAKSAGLEKEEVERRIEAKRAKLSGLISKEGAAQVVAAELGVSFENEKLKINELLTGMKKANVVGKVINIFPVREFERNGQANKVCNFMIADDTGNTKVVLWDTNHIGLIENGKISEETVIEIINGSVREGEIHLGSFSELKISEEKISSVKTEKEVNEKPIIEFRISDNVKIRAFVVQAFDMKFFHVCPQCKKKAIIEGEKGKCNEHGEVVPEKRALTNLVIDDGTESIRAVFFHEALQSLGFDDYDNAEKIAQQKQNLLGKEMFFEGVVRNNSYFNNPELIVNNVQDLDVSKLIEVLENK